LGHGHDAEDAFQAAFVVFLRKAAAIRKPELLGNWLYGVAYRIALKARANAARRTSHERQAASMSALEPDGSESVTEMRELLDEELNRLPEKYRAPLVLCYLQGKTNAEAARCLGWPIGSMSWRLNQGREKLRDRIMAPPPVPEPRLLSTAKVAGAAGPSASVTALAEDSLRLLARARRRVALVLLLLALFLGSGVLAWKALAGGEPIYFNKNLLFGAEGCGTQKAPAKK
jgi:RNA polymerase sigma factor (sigma-70 family)